MHDKYVILYDNKMSWARDIADCIKYAVQNKMIYK